MKESIKLKILGCIDVIVASISTILIFWGMPKNPWWFWMIIPACVGFSNAIEHFHGRKAWDCFFEDEE